MNPAPLLPVDRCFCHDVLFARILELARETGADLDGLSKLTGCCTGCGLCKPYVRAALRTGISRFPVLNPPQLEALKPLPSHAPVPPRVPSVDSDAPRGS